MGSGTWTSTAFVNYSTVTKGMAVKDDLTLDGRYSAQDIFKMCKLAAELNPFRVVRECRDTAEHSETIPVILALDVTGSMGSAAAEVAKKLNTIMTKLYESVKDVEFMIMAIGDLAYDGAPIQASQFESDIRIAEQLDKVYFEGGGGGNSYESYTAAWYFGSRHTDLDCWKRGKKGIIITMGDEPLNPYLPQTELNCTTGDMVQADIETAELWKEVREKFDVFHLAVNDDETSYKWYKDQIKATWRQYLDAEHLMTVNLNNIVPAIVDIVSKCADAEAKESTVSTGGGISW